MTRELKVSLKMMKYGNNIKSNIGCGALFFLLGIVFVVRGGMETGGIVLGSTYIFLSVMMIKQIAYSLHFVGLVASSPRKKIIEIYMLDVLDFISGMICYVILLMMVWIQNQFAVEQNVQCGNALVFAGLEGGLILVYQAASIKSFLLSSVGYVMGFCIILMNMDRVIFSISPTGGAVTGFLFVLLGVVLAGVLRRLIYRKPLSRYAVGQDLRKQV
ncbi:MAG: hypothetical protein K2J90_14865 [Lachnospiraceae bacterium]|nr:hypothetical protein [Lachnospiraceae bacterium]